MQTTRISRLTSPPVLLLFGCCTLAFGIFAFVTQYARQQGLVAEGGVVEGRDFLAFYTGGRLVLDGDGAHLYDLGKQQEVQDRTLAPETLDGFLPFLNPPSVALAYAPLARLPYRRAFFLHTAAMGLILLCGIVLLLPALKGLSSHGWVVVALGLSWPPMLVSTLGGQNAALSFALMSAAYVALRAGRDGLAGLSLGLLLFKPQYALPFAGLLLLRRRFVSVGVFGGVALAHYALGAVVSGWDWPRDMLEMTTGPFRVRERLANGAKHIAIPELLDYWVLLRFEASEWAAWLGTGVRVLTISLVVAGVLLLVWTWRRARPEAADFPLHWALVVPIMLLISPHAQYYEIALLLLPVLLVLDQRVARGEPVTSRERLALLAGYFVLPLHRLSEVLPFQPLVLVPVAVAVWILRERHRQRLGLSRPAPGTWPGSRPVLRSP